MHGVCVDVLGVAVHVLFVALFVFGSSFSLRLLLGHSWHALRVSGFLCRLRRLFLALAGSRAVVVIDVVVLVGIRDVEVLGAIDDVAFVVRPGRAHEVLGDDAVPNMGESVRVMGG